MDDEALFWEFVTAERQRLLAEARQVLPYRLSDIFTCDICLGPLAFEDESTVCERCEESKPRPILTVTLPPCDETKHERD